MSVGVELVVNGRHVELTVDVRTSLLEALREELELSGAKRGCDHGQCGACTVLLDGQRVVSCLLLAVAVSGSEVVTAEGLSNGALHPVQQAFVDHDAFQCGFCTPGQICSAVGMLHEIAAGRPSLVTANLGLSGIRPDARELRERMSGNLCRCGAYANIVAALEELAS